MNLQEFDDQFDVLFNNITSNQAPGLNTYEKSVFLTKAQDEIVKNYFSAGSKGNSLGLGFDDSAKRQADFSHLMQTASLQTASLVDSSNNINISYTVSDGEGTSTVDPETGESIISTGGTATFTVEQIDPRSKVYAFPGNVFIVINESLYVGSSGNYTILQVLPLKYDEYVRLMSKPYKRPCKNQAWRLINQGKYSSNLDSDNRYQKIVEIITGPNYDSSTMKYVVRYIRKPKPIIVGDLDGLTINGYSYSDLNQQGCELDPILHEDILQRAVELAKVAWTSNGQDNVQLVMQAGQRSE